MNIETINKEIQDFENLEIQIVPGFMFNQKQTIDRIYRLYNSKFENGSTDADGDKKYFFNINRNPCKVTTKAIDFDTKDIKIMTAAGGDALRTWYFERDLKFWMKDVNFGILLNRIFEELPKFGSVVLKIIKGVPHFIDLRNFVVEQSADMLSQSNYIIEKHNYSAPEFRRTGNQLGWENIDEAIKQHRDSDAPYITVYERYGEVAQLSENGTKTYKYMRVLVADPGEDPTVNIGNSVPTPGVTLKETEVDTHPYWEIHLEKIPGRWMGVGTVEVLFDNQTRENEIANLQSKASYWNALRVFQTRDDTINRNLMSEVKNGEVLNVDSEIAQVDMSDRNLAYFNQESQKWMQNRDEVTFSYDVVRGDTLPSGTPLGSARLAAAQAGTYFDQIRENIALNIKDLLYKVIIPNFSKQNSTEHTLRLIGTDLDKFRNMLINRKSNDELLKFALKKGKVPSFKQYEFIKASVGEKVKQGTEKLLKIPKGFYQNLKYKIDIIITGESKDTQVWAQTLFAALQAITVDPGLLTDPTKKKFFFKWLEAGGVSPADFATDQPVNMEQLAQGTPVGGGGVSRPASVGAGATAPSEQRI